jgi:hypothetical protein
VNRPAISGKQLFLHVQDEFAELIDRRHGKTGSEKIHENSKNV